MRLLARLPAETAHGLALLLLESRARLGLQPRETFSRKLRISLLGTEFQSRIGFAAGLDKNAACLRGLSAYRPGHMEIGTITPEPQKGNPKPRLFRIPEQLSLVNSLGFNNLGVEAVCRRLRGFARTCPIGINLGPNYDTPASEVHLDYIRCMQETAWLADWITLNLSSPNTATLREVSSPNRLSTLLGELSGTVEELEKRELPVLIKLSPDYSRRQWQEVLSAVLDSPVAGVIIGNSSSKLRARLVGARFRSGGLSGAGLRELSARTLGICADRLAGSKVLIACGGVFTREEAKRRLKQGADLIQVYTGFVYRGSDLVGELSGL